MNNLPDMLRGLFLRPQQQQEQQNLPAQQPPHFVRDSAGSMVSGAGPMRRQFRMQQSWTPEQSPKLLRLGVADELATLKPGQRHLLVELLHDESSFACLFAYDKDVPSGAAACTVALTDSHQEILKRLKAQVVNGSSAQTEPTNTQLEHLDEERQSTASARPSEDAKAPAVSVACVPEFSVYGKDASDARVVVSLRAAVQEEQRQGNIAVTSVLDVSGSMSGRRLQLLQETSHFLVQQVTAKDFLGFVTYAADTNVDVPLMRMTPKAKLFTHAVLSSLQAGGNTALYAGAVAGMRQQLEELDDTKLAKALFLCTDGEANVGLTTSDEILPSLHKEQTTAGQACTIHTFGIGEGHCAPLLQAVAESMSGTYYFIKSNMDVAPSYGDALGCLLSVMAKDVHVTVKNLNAAAGVELPSIDADGIVNGHTVTFNDLYSEENKTVLLNFKLPALQLLQSNQDSSSSSSTKEAMHVQLAEVVVGYVDPVTGKQETVQLPIRIQRSMEPSDPAAAPDPLVLATAARYETAQCIKTAQRLGEVGDHKGALALLKSCATKRSTESAAPQVNAEAAAQLNMLRDQTQAAFDMIEQAARSRADQGARQQAYTAMASVSHALQVQRTAGAGYTSSAAMSSAPAFDNRTRQVMRQRASEQVTAAVSGKNGHRSQP